MDYSTKEDMIEYLFEKAGYLILPSEENNYKSKFLQSNILLGFIGLLLLLKIVTVLIPINFPQNIFFADITKSALENFVNQTRQSDGLQPLVENQKLDLAAQLKAQNMVQYQYFNHTSPSGVSPWYWFSQAGYTYKYAGENLAIGFYDSLEVYNAWLNSPGHKANIINPHYTEVGTAVLSGFGQNNSIVVVQEFGTAQKVNNSKSVVTQPATNVQSSTTNTQATADNNEKVLSQSTEAQISIKSSTGNGINNFPSKILNSVLYNYNGLLQDVIYGVSFIIIGILLILIFFNFHINFKKELVFRAVLIILILSVTTLINRGLVISLIPHKMII